MTPSTHDRVLALVQENALLLVAVVVVTALAGAATVAILALT
jgi:hypothetical protein